MSEHTLKLVEAIRRRLQTTINRITLAELITGLLLIAGISTAILLIALGIEASLWLDVTTRTVLFWILIIVTSSVAIVLLARPLLRRFGLISGLSEDSVASRIGARYPEVADRLSNMLDLVNGHRTEAPDSLVDSAVRMLGTQLQNVPFEKVEDFRRVRRVGRFAAIPVVLVLLLFTTAPSTFMGASARLFSPGTVFERPAPFQFIVEPGSTEVVKGEPLSLSIRTRGKEAPRTISLFVNNIGEDKENEIRLERDSSGAFNHTLVNIRQPIRYRAAAQGVESPWFKARLTERPLVRNLQVSLEFPGYTGIAPQRLEPNIGNVTAYPGTEVSLDVTLGGRDIDEAFIQFDDGTVDTLTLNGYTASGSFTLHRKGTYSIHLKNSEGISNSNPITYTMSLLSDGFPSVALIEPEPLSLLDENLDVPVLMRITDDFGFSRLQLHYRLSESRFETPMESFETIPLTISNPKQLDQEIPYDWLISQTTSLDPVPGDEIEFFVQVWDNDSFSGYKSAKSPVYKLRLPSLAEQYEELEKNQENAESILEELLQESQGVREDFETLRDELRSKQSSDWEDERQLEQLQHRQQQVEEKVESLSEQIESITRSMEQNNLVDEQTLDMYRELQQVVNEISSPELQEALRQLQEAMQNLDLSKLQESLGNFEFNEQQYRQRLERTLDLFKKLRMQQNIEEAAHRLEELAQRQERLASETGKLRENEQNSENSDNESTENSDKESSENSDNESSENKENHSESSNDNQQQNQEESGENANPTDKREELAREQERSSAEMEALQKRLEEMQKQASELTRGPEEQLQKLNEQLQREQLPNKMEQNSEQLRNNQLENAQQGQQQMQQTLQQLQQQLQNMQQQMQQASMNVNMAGLRRVLDNILTLSQQQEALRGRVQQQAGDSPQLRTHAQEQVRLAEGLTVVSDSLQKLSRDIPQMNRAVQQKTGEALRSMSSATESMAERVSAQASSHQKSAMMHLNELALLLSDLMNQMMNSQGGSGGMSLQQMIEQLQNMAGDQEKLNQELQQLLNDAQGNRLTQSMEERLQQMSAQQEEIRRQLRELSRNPASRGKLLGDLEKIAEQMEETIQELQRASADRRTIERQQQILTRLLDAQRSLRERGEEKRRESRSGQDSTRESPGELSPMEEAEKLRRDLLRALESGYAPDYQELIKRYFDLLQKHSNSTENGGNE